MTTANKIGHTVAPDSVAADGDVLNRTVVIIPAKDWETFEAGINRPTETIPALRKLAAVIPPSIR